MALTRIADNLWTGTVDPAVGELRQLWCDAHTGVVVGHPTFRNERTIGPLLSGGIAAAVGSFDGRHTCFVVSDGTLNRNCDDGSTMAAAVAAARESLAALSAAERALVQVVVTPYDGYDGDYTPGKGSALKMIFDELAGTDVSLLALLDGDLRNDMRPWQQVFAGVEREHQHDHGSGPFFVTARYARHFVDASLTRFIVGPLTTLMGRYVPGGISGDIALSAGAVAHERESAWTEARRKYGTDISTTFDNIADPNTVIYEVYLGAKLHDITDEAKLSVMPGEVIGAALERLLHWERERGCVTAMLSGSAALEPLVTRGPERTGIDFVDPGYTDVFDVDAKMAALLSRFSEFADDIRCVQGDDVLRRLEHRHRRLAARQGADGGPVTFLAVEADEWIAMIHRAVAYTLVYHDTERPKRCLAYLYTAAFLEFVKNRLADLGLATLPAVRKAQHHLGVPPQRAAEFYEREVDRRAEQLARDFFARREQISVHIAEFGG